MVNETRKTQDSGGFFDIPIRTTFTPVAAIICIRRVYTLSATLNEQTGAGHLYHLDLSPSAGKPTTATLGPECGSVESYNQTRDTLEVDR